jgi:hypothetical protein
MQGRRGGSGDGGKMRDRNQRRNLNANEMYALGFVELAIDNDDDGWPYRDDDDDETTENRLIKSLAQLGRKWWNGHRVH